MAWWSWESDWVSFVLLVALGLGGLAGLLVLALRSEFAPWARQPINPSVTDPRDVLALQLVRGDVDDGEYLDQIESISEEPDA